MGSQPTNKRGTGRRRSIRAAPSNLICRNGIYYVRIQVEGRERRVSLDTTDLDEARIRAPKILAALKADREDAKFGVLWQRAALSYAEYVFDVDKPDLKPATIARYKSSWRVIRPWFDGKLIHQIDQGFLLKFIRERKAEGKSNGTILNNLVSVSVVLDHALSMQWLPVNPVLLLGRRGRPRRTDAKRYPMPTWPQIERLASRNKSAFGDIILMLALTGCRQQEIVGLRRSQLIRDKDAGLSLVLTNTKSGFIRTIRLNGTARDIVERQLKSGPDDYIFRSKEGGKFKAASAQYITMRDSLRRADPNFPLFRMHDLRHFWAVQALRSGMNIFAVSRNLGHSSVMTTEQHYLRYLNNDDALRARMEASLVDSSGIAYDPSDPLTYDALDVTSAVLPHEVGSGGSDQERSE